jgi:hypothetical protein
MSVTCQHEPSLVFTVLPGPDRKRSRSPYGYRVTYRSPDPTRPGCVLIWKVSGGRMPYQLALERDEKGNLRLHCTCADAVFRAEAEGRFCKHARGLVEVSRQTAAAAEVAEGPTCASA